MTVAITLIILLVNTIAFAEPLNKTLTYKYDKEETIESEDSLHHSMIISVKQAEQIMKKGIFTASKSSLESLFSKFKEMLRIKVEIQEIYISTGKIVENMMKNIEEKELATYESINQTIIYIHKWDEKDRIIPQDFSDEDSNFIS